MPEDDAGFADDPEDGGGSLLGFSVRFSGKRMGMPGRWEMIAGRLTEMREGGREKCRVSSDL